MRYLGGSIYLRKWVKCWKSLDSKIEGHDMTELDRRLQLCYQRLDLQDIGDDDYVDNLPEMISCLPYKLKFPIHAALKDNLEFYSPN